MAKRARIANREKLLAKMAALPGEIRSAIRQSLAQGADEITDMQKRLVPKKTGKLRDSIRQNWGGALPKYASLKAGAEAGDPDLTVTITAGNRQVGYAHLVEFGTAPHEVGGKFKGAQHPGSEAKPFFFPPYRALRRRVRSRITRAVKKAAREVAAK